MWSPFTKWSSISAVFVVAIAHLPILLGRCRPPITYTFCATSPSSIYPLTATLHSPLLCHFHGRHLSGILLLFFFMSATAPSRRRYRRTPSSGRFLDVLSLPAPASPNSGEELHEEELFWIGGLSEPPSASTLQNPRSRRRGAQGTSGILAALPESDAYGRPMLSQKTSSSRMIPAIPKPTVERHVAASAKCHKSAPVNVPVLSKGVRRLHAVDDEESDDGADREMFPPHEIVARGSGHSPVLSCSVLEGVGRTLKGRDLRQVRNAVWLQTGFLD